MVAISYLVLYDTLLQCTTDIIAKSDSFFITKCDKSLSQNTSAFLFQFVTVLSQNGTVIGKCDNVITKYDICSKIRRLLQNLAVHRVIKMILH